MNKNHKIIYCIISVVLIFSISIIAWAYKNKKFGIFASGEVKAIAVESQSQWEASGSLENLNFDPKGLIIKGLGIDSQYKVTPIVENQNQNNKSNLKLAQTSNTIPMRQKSDGGCSGYLPDNWTMVTKEDALSIACETYKNDITMSASYLLALVTNAVSLEYDGTSPEKYIQTFFIPLNNISDFKYTSSPYTMDNNYKLAFWTGIFNKKPVKGFSYYTTFTMPDSHYIIAIRSGIIEANLWKDNSAIVFDSAVSIKCNKSLYSTADGPDKENNNKGSSGSDIAAVAEKDREAIMGYENAYSPSTGEHFEVPVDLYNATGPDGAGYYRSTGTNSYEKLNMGFGY